MIILYSNTLRRCGSVIGGGILLFAGGLLAAPLTWVPGPPLDWPVSDATTAAVPGLGNVLIGGDVSFYSESLAAASAYWMALPAISEVKIAAGAVANGDLILVYGGNDGTASSSTVVGYSPSGDTPQTFPSMGVARSYLGYAPDHNGNAYAIGGLDGSGQALASAERLNPDSSTWSAIASLPVARYRFPAVFDGTNSIYIFGGYTNTTSVTESASVLRYSVSGNTWNTVASLPVNVAGSAAAMGADGRIYVVGGVSGGVTTNVVQVYDAAANTWAIATPLPEGLSASAMGVDSQGRLILMGGLDATGNDVNHVWRSQLLGAPDSPPVFVSYPGTNAIYLAPYSSSVTASGNPQPMYLLIQGPTNMVVDYLSGAITWTPQGLDQVGAIPVTIRATNYAGFVDWNFTLTVPNPPPTPPTNIQVVGATEYSITLAWEPESPVVGPVTYGVYIPHPIHTPRGSGGVIYELVGSSTSNNVTITGLKPNSSYSFDLNAKGSAGSSGYAGVSASTTGPQPPPNLRVTGITSASISLAWDPSPGPVPIARFELVGWIGGMFPTIGYGANYTNTAATITGLTPGTDEEWAVRAYDAAGNVSGFSGGVSAVNPVPTAARLNSVAWAANGSFQLTVSEGGSTLQTVLIQATTNLADPNAWTQIGSVLPTANPFTFTDTNAARYPRRWYRIVAP